ncbi:MAG: hypothetical protein ACRELV_10920 [Longimicrobiales bacterium]
MAKTRKAPRLAAEEFTEAVTDRLGDRIRGVLLYGSLARGEAIPGVSDVNLLVTLTSFESAEIVALAPLARRWTKSGNTAPLVLLETEWRQAADVFAVELSDMIDARELLHGEDPVDGAMVATSSLRLQTERELRGKLIQLREGIMITAEKPKELGTLLLRALPSFTTYQRAILRLAGRPVPADTEHVIREACALVDAEPNGFLDVWRARRANETIRCAPGDAVVHTYRETVERLTTHVDRILEEEHP